MILLLALCLVCFWQSSYYSMVPCKKTYGNQEEALVLD